MEKFPRVYRASLVISFAHHSVGTNLTASFDHQALSEIYCVNELHKLLRKWVAHGSQLLQLAFKITGDMYVVD